MNIAALTNCSKVALINALKNDKQIPNITWKYTYFLQHALWSLQILMWQKKNNIKSQSFKKLNKKKLMFRI